MTFIQLRKHYSTMSPRRQNASPVAANPKGLQQYQKLPYGTYECGEQLMVLGNGNLSVSIQSFHHYEVSHPRLHAAYSSKGHGQGVH